MQITLLILGINYVSRPNDYIIIIICMQIIWITPNIQHGSLCYRTEANYCDLLLFFMPQHMWKDISLLELLRYRTSFILFSKLKIT